MKAVALTNTSPLKENSQSPDSMMNKDAKDATNTNNSTLSFFSRAQIMWAIWLMKEAAQRASWHFWKKKGWPTLLLSPSKRTTAYPWKWAGTVPHFSLAWMNCTGTSLLMTPLAEPFPDHAVPQHAFDTLCNVFKLGDHKRCLGHSTLTRFISVVINM